ncbi:hypothetical protein AB434_2256 [Heyndrickxia coagulans]|uniref:Uncharacterized protein n=1 Tax=Heyndrickxia coagulans TaxID=1398 RepID=A0AAN0T7C0_HEYCO|nr:hypothetical protein SB48_HM08orf04888 [Heyndrickxia coagulans]AKN54661.1 hypothetical protein AB434_2256 [Heyndrickxia coagulans]KYC62901.1 hypothetical protein B4100_0405 [Heyndrickxia coagulans]KYC73640.1 hypothetical protein B4096_0380 [Heyndrickxia coagulans]
MKTWNNKWRKNLPDFSLSGKQQPLSGLFLCYSFQKNLVNCFLLLFILLA